MTETWREAYDRINREIRNDSAFRSLAVAMSGYPRHNTRRARRIADQICGRLGLSPGVFRGNVYGAGVEAIERRTLS